MVVYHDPPTAPPPPTDTASRTCRRTPASFDPDPTSTLSREPCRSWLNGATSAPALPLLWPGRGWRAGVKRRRRHRGPLPRGSEGQPRPPQRRAGGPRRRSRKINKGAASLSVESALWIAVSSLGSSFLLEFCISKGFTVLLFFVRWLECLCPYREWVEGSISISFLAVEPVVSRWCMVDHSRGWTLLKRCNPFDSVKPFQEGTGSMVGVALGWMLAGHAVLITPRSIAPLLEKAPVYCWLAPAHPNLAVAPQENKI